MNVNCVALSFVIVSHLCCHILASDGGGYDVSAFELEDCDTAPFYGAVAKFSFNPSPFLNLSDYL